MPSNQHMQLHKNQKGRLSKKTASSPPATSEGEKGPRISHSPRTPRTGLIQHCAPPWNICQSLNNRICAGCTPPAAPCNAHGAESCPSTWHKQGDTTDFPHGTGSPGSAERLRRRNGDSSFLRLPPELEQHHCEQC